MREGAVPLIYGFDVVADERRARTECLQVIGSVLEVLARRGRIKPEAVDRAAVRPRSAPAQQRPRPDTP